MEVSTFLKIWILILSVTTFCCILASSVGNQWVALTMTKDSKSLVAVTNGLWRECVDDRGQGFVCRNIKNQPHWMMGDMTWLDTARIIAVASCALAFLTIVWSIVGFVRPSASYLATLCSLLSSGTISAVLIMYHAENQWTRQHNFEYGWSFNVGVVGAVVSGVSFLLGLFIGVYVENKEIHKINYKRHSKNFY